MNPQGPFILTGEDAEAFIRYTKRKPTKEEIEYMRDAEAFYLEHQPRD